MPIAVTTVVNDTFWQCIKYKILLKIVLEIALSNILTTQKIQNSLVIYFQYIILCTYVKYVFEILVFHIVHNTGHHRASGGQFLGPHMVRDCPASLSHQANTFQRIIDFSLFDRGGLALSQSLPKDLKER